VGITLTTPGACVKRSLRGLAATPLGGTPISGPLRPPDPIRRVLWEKDGGFSWQREPGARAALKIRQSGRIARIALAPEAI